MMEERRRSPRELTLLTGRIITGDTSTALDCAVLDTSATGANLLVPTGAITPETFVLIIDPLGTRRHCRVVWRRESRIGVCFDSTADADQASG